MVDIEVGEIFLNFTINEDLRNYYGVDVTHVRSTDIYMDA